MKTLKGNPAHMLLREEGTELLEMALICILLFTLLFGIAGFGLALYTYHFVSNASREATRWAAVNGYTCGSDSSCNGTNGMSNGPATAAAITTYVMDHVPPGISPANVSVAASWPVVANSPSVCTTVANNVPGCTVQVKVSYNYVFIFPLIRTAPLPLSSTSEMVISH